MTAVLAGVLSGFACLCLLLHICACLVAAARGRRRAAQGDAEAGVTLLMPLDAAAPAELERALKSAFAEDFGQKEVIFCAGALDKRSRDIIRSVREANAAVPSLLIAARSEAGEGAADSGSGGLRESLIKGWKAARYDRVVTALPNAVLPADYISRFTARDRQAAGKTGLVFAPLWAVNPRGLQARLRALLMNGAQARRALLADCLGRGMAENSPGLWHYELLNNAGGIDAFMEKAGGEGLRRAATELARSQNMAIHLAAKPLACDLSAARQADCAEAGMGIGGEQGGGRGGIFTDYLGSLHCCRRFLPALFYAEPLLNIFLPALACASACALRGGMAWGGLIVFLSVWYGAEFAFCASWGRKAGRMGGLKTCALLPLREILPPVLWLIAWAWK